MKSSQNNLTKDAEHAVADMADRARDTGKNIVRGAEDIGTAAKRGLEDATDAMKDAARDLSNGTMEDSEASSTAAQVMRKAQSVAQDAKEAVVAKAASTVSAVREAAVERADGARESLSDVGDRIAASLNRASAEALDSALQSRLLTSVAQGLSKASTTLRERSVTDLADDVKVFARRHPGAFMAAAAVVGFAAARFVKSSARRRVDAALLDNARGPRS